jgi:hypothetical protein
MPPKAQDKASKAHATVVARAWRDPDDELDKVAGGDGWGYFSYEYWHDF